MTRVIARVFIVACAATAACGTGAGAGNPQGADGGAPVEAGAAGGVGCGAHPGALFCDDFEASQPLDVDWEPVGSNNFLFPTLEQTATAYSPTHVMLATASGIDAGIDTVFCEADHQLATPTGAAVHFGVSFRVPGTAAASDGGPPNAPGFTVQIRGNPFSPVTGGFEASIQIVSGQIQLDMSDDGEGTSAMPPAPQTLGPFEPGKWSRIELTIDLTPPQSVTASLANGAQGTPVPFHVAPSSYSGPYSLSLALLTSSGPSAGGAPAMTSSVEFDDVVFEQ